MCLSAWLVAVTCVAVPAKKGFWKAITLKDGTTVQAQLCGDEHLHFWETPDGKRYLVESETGRYIPADMDKLRQKANARKARVSQARAQRRVRIGGNHDPYIGKKKGLIILLILTLRMFNLTTRSITMNLVLKVQAFGINPIA